MIAVIFEVWPADGCKAHYMDHAARLRDVLNGMDGFISVERFQSLTDPDKLLSLSFWRDEAAVAGWRNQSDHRGTQTVGRNGHLSRLPAARRSRRARLRHGRAARAGADG